MGSRQRSNSAKLIYWVIGAVFSVLLAGTGEGLAFRYNLWTSPGAYVWGRLHPDEASWESLFGTMLAIDSICWFILLYLAWFIIARLGKKNDADRIDTRK